MSLKICQQTLDNNCSSCVITTLHNYFYNANLNVNDVLEKSKQDEFGLNILDFEHLAQNFQIKCETYEVGWDEFRNFKHNNIFAVILNMNGNIHYSIAKKNNKKIILYDSIDGKKEMTYEQFRLVYSGIIIFTSKTAKSVKRNVDDFLVHIDQKYLMLSFLLNIVTVFCSITTSMFLNAIISIAITNQSISNLIAIILFFGSTMAFQNLFEYIIFLYSKNNTSNNIVFFSSNYYSKLLKKNQLFKNKVNIEWAYQMNDTIATISSYFSQEINDFLASLLMFFVSSCMLVFVKPEFLIITFLVMGYQTILCIIRNKKQDEILKDIYKINVHENKTITDFKNNITNNNDYDVTRYNVELMKKNAEKYILKINENILFGSNYKLATNFCDDLLFIIMIIIISIFFIVNPTLNIGLIFMILSLIELNKKSIASAQDFYLNHKRFKFHYQIYQSYCSIGNLNDQMNDFEISDFLHFTNNDLYFDIQRNSTITAKQLSYLNNVEWKIYTNKAHINNINSTVQFNKMILKINEKTQILDTWKNELCNNTNCIKAIEELSIDFDNKLNNGIILLLIAYVLIEKIMIIDISSLNLTQSQQQYYCQKLKPYIEKKNFILYLGGS